MAWFATLYQMYTTQCSTCVQLVHTMLAPSHNAKDAKQVLGALRDQTRARCAQLIHIHLLLMLVASLYALTAQVGHSQAREQSNAKDASPIQLYATSRLSQ